MRVPSEPDFEVRLPADPEPHLSDGDSAEINDDPGSFQA
jgi:hypothetical protein